MKPTASFANPKSHIACPYSDQKDPKSYQPKSQQPIPEKLRVTPGTANINLEVYDSPNTPQSLQNPLIKEYTLNHIRDPLYDLRYIP